LNILTEDSHKGSSNNERYTGCCIEKYQRLLTSYPVKNQQGSLEVNEHNSKKNQSSSRNSNKRKQYTNKLTNM